MTLVVDSSAIISWVMPDETGADFAALSARHEDILAPWLFWVEVRNILIVSERRGRLPQGIAEQIAAAIDQLGFDLDTQPAQAVVFDLARRHQLSAYDALYLELALRTGASLASLDRALVSAAEAEGVKIEVR